MALRSFYQFCPFYIIMCSTGVFILNLMVMVTKINSAAVLKCTEEFCEEYQTNVGCPDINDTCKDINSTYNSSFLRYPDTCNCCDYCLTHLKEGDECEMGMPGLPPPKEICGPTLYCTANNNGPPTCEKMKSSCLLDQENYDEIMKEGLVGIREIRPKCKADGFYAPYHCIPGSICYCIAPTGERIFGEMPFISSTDEEQMSCGCSLDTWKALNILRHEDEIPMIRCTESGLYDPLQCTAGSNSFCFCIDTITGALNQDISVVEESDIDQLPCFDPSRHSKQGYTTICEKLYKNSTYSNIPNDIENYCQIDGKFSRIQMLGSRKMCVDPNGKKIGNFETSEGTPEAKIMNCNCARTRWILQQSGIKQLPKCCSFGNFESWQCSQEECFCADTNGNQIGLEVPLNKLSTLSCYLKNKGNPCLVE